MLWRVLLVRFLHFYIHTERFNCLTNCCIELKIEENLTIGENNTRNRVSVKIEQKLPLFGAKKKYRKKYFLSFKDGTP